MSIQDQINAWIRCGDLIHLKPLYATKPAKRDLIVSREVWEFIETGPWESQEIGDWASDLRADLDSFILDPIVARIRPRQRDDANIAILEPASDRVWEVRSLTPCPQIRVFGAFAFKDVFIALNWADRDYLGDPGPPGDPEGRRWNDAIRTCKTRWSHFFPTYPRLNGADIHDFISNNVTVV